MTATVGKTEALRDGSTPSTASSPEPEPAAYTQDNPQQQQKRKGGRKPKKMLLTRRKIYATSEERKQRNRQAQAAFRERRTEYIKQLESTIKHHEETLQNLQQSHRSAADECLMLRYKNSLLERILLEKGIDVQAELQAKTGSPNLGPTRQPTSTTASPNQPALQQRAMMNNRQQQQNRRSLGGMPNKAEGVHGLPMIQPDGAVPNRSPLSQPTPGSHLPSPVASATRSPNFMPQGISVSPNFGSIPPQQHPQRHPQLQPQPPRSQYTPMMGPQRPSLNTSQLPKNGISNGTPVGSSANVMSRSSTSGGTQTYFPTPYSEHMTQLGKLSQQEYDEQTDMLDQEDPSDHSTGPGPYPHPFSSNSMQSQQSMQPPMPPAQTPQFPNSAAMPTNDGNHAFNGMNQLFDPYDPMLDADPFGLSASMHFPTIYESR
ncbi:hypothetical protein BU23DRAFT_646864 [Bimuria novae-zelandiae CBS 107.79]|uniref:BZIP domain-containing protein n=1 Tax=Bimuria novae-zelandiae CBS 107.79 TaxID=1447943 RepID=A0A6A5V8D6_9PLEO|nr:hypothetical protein BU23DRAFT_646864 [Bimuria novae-zelandiae CBS 107.79]